MSDMNGINVNSVQLVTIKDFGEEVSDGISFINSLPHLDTPGFVVDSKILHSFAIILRDGSEGAEYTEHNAIHHAYELVASHEADQEAGGFDLMALLGGSSPPVVTGPVYMAWLDATHDFLGMWENSEERDPKDANRWQDNKDLVASLTDRELRALTTVQLLINPNFKPFAERLAGLAGI